MFTTDPEDPVCTNGKWSGNTRVHRRYLETSPTGWNRAFRGDTATWAPSQLAATQRVATSVRAVGIWHYLII